MKALPYVEEYIHNIYALCRAFNGYTYFQDSLAKRFSDHCLANKALEARAILLDGFYALQEHRRGVPTLEYLEGVASVRFSLSVVAEVLKNEANGQHFMELLRAAGQMCSDREVNCIDPTGRKDTVGPVIYLLKLIVRQYGMACLKAAAEVHEWLIPAELKSEEVCIITICIIVNISKFLLWFTHTCTYIRIS